MPNVNILKLNDILRDKNDAVPERGKIKSIQISDKIVEGLKNKNISPSTIKKLSRMQGTIVSDRREVHHKIDGYNFYITDYRGKRGHYETVKVSYRTEKLLMNQNEIEETTNTVRKSKAIATVKKAIINAKLAKVAKKVNRDELLNQPLKIVDFKELKKEKQEEIPKKLVQTKKTNLQTKAKQAKPSAKLVKKTTTVKSNSTLKVNKRPNLSNFKDNNIATKQNISKSFSKQPKSIKTSNVPGQWYTPFQTKQKNGFWGKLTDVSKRFLNCFNITRLVKKGW